MASRPILIDTTLFLARTTHLSCEEIGALGLLVMRCHQYGGAIISDDKAVARLARINLRVWRRIKPVLLEFFDERDGMLSLNENGALLLFSKDQRPPIPRFIRDEVFARDGRRCIYCGDGSGPFHLDHVVPYSRGGASTLENLAVACRACNLAKSDRTPQEMGWLDG